MLVDVIFESTGDDSTKLRSGAQNSNGVNVYIDGVGQKSYVKEGGVSGQFATNGNPFAQLAIGEYKVITSNYKAEYGQISSAAVTAVRPDPNPISTSSISANPEILSSVSMAATSSAEIRLRCQL